MSYLPYAPLQQSRVDKSVLGFRQFSMRGLHRRRWKLVCMALNLRRMAVPSAS